VRAVARRRSNGYHRAAVRMGEAPPPVAVEYRRTVPLWGDRSDAYLESYECARAFRKAAEKK
jgi:hypothetical protein